MLFLELVVIFLAGCAQDSLNAYYVRSCAEQKRARAAIVSGLATVVTCVVLTRLLAGVRADAAGAQLVAYACGSGVGTFVGLKRVS